MQGPWSRRKFLGVAAGAATVITTRRLARAVEPSQRFGGFDVGMQSYTLREMTVDRALEEIKNLGLHGVEMFNAHFSGKSSPADIEAMKSKTQALGIKMTGHGVNGFSKDHAANRRWFEFAKQAGIRNLSADPTEDAFDSLDKLCEEFQIRIAIHNHGPGGLRQSLGRAAHNQGTSPADRRMRRPGTLHSLSRRPRPRNPSAGRPALWSSPERLRRAEVQNRGRHPGPRPPGRRRGVSSPAQK